MSGISSGIGLISGLPTASLIEQLLAIEARPLNLVKLRITNVQAQRTALADISARLLALKNSVVRFSQPAFFNNFAATSSDPDVLTAAVSEHATVGNYSFIVRSLVTHNQLIGAGLADADSTPIGAGTFTVEIGGGRLHRATPLADLRGGAGVGRGRIRVTDRSGAATTLDLTHAITVDDVLDAFNQQSAVNVRARVSGDQIVVQDLTDPASATAALSISDLAGGTLAVDLGLSGSAPAGSAQLSSADLLKLADGTLLSNLNDGNGVRRALAGGDFDITVGTRNFRVALDGFLQPQTRLDVLNNGHGVRLGVVRITDRGGHSADVDLSHAQTIADVLSAINEADVGVEATVINSRLQISDTTGVPADATTHLRIQDVTGFAARDLGIAADVSANTILGSNIYRISTVGDVVRAINFATDSSGTLNDVLHASIADGGNGLTLTASTGEIIKVTKVTAADGSTSEAAHDLGIAGNSAAGAPLVSRDLLAGLNTVLLHTLNGGHGVSLGAVSFTARDGTATQIDFAGAQTVQDILDRINATTATSKLTANLNPVGNGIEIRDVSGSTAGPLAITDVGAGTTAADLGIAGTAAGSTLNGGNVQLQYVSGATRLADLNNGRGVRAGQFRITAANGASFTVNVGTNQKTVGDVLRLINAAAVPGVSAAVNDHGDGIIIRDATTGAGTLRVENVSGGLAASDLNIARQAGTGQAFVDGSFEFTVDLDSDDTLNDVVSKLNSSGAALTAAVINDGGSTNPFRLSVTSGMGGRGGYVLLDTGSIDLGLQTLVEGQDAVIELGEASAANPLIITSASNTLTGVVPGVTLNLVSASDEPVSLSINQNLDGIVQDIKNFVTNYNAVVDRIDQLTKFDSETNQRGVLLGNSTVGLVRDRLFRTVTGSFTGGASAISRLSAIGVHIVSGGGLSFDEDRFRDAYADDPQAVEQLFGTDDTGVGDALQKMLDGLTDASDGILPRQDHLLGDQVDLLNDRVTALQALLDRKRGQLQRQFQGLESALAALQGQQQSLTALTALAAQFG